MAPSSFYNPILQCVRSHLLSFPKMDQNGPNMEPNLLCIFFRINSHAHQIGNKRKLAFLSPLCSEMMIFAWPDGAEIN